LSRMKMHQWNCVYKIARAHSAAGIVLQAVCTSCEIYWYTYIETKGPNWHSAFLHIEHLSFESYLPSEPQTLT